MTFKNAKTPTIKKTEEIEKKKRAVYHGEEGRTGDLLRSSSRVYAGCRRPFDGTEFVIGILRGRAEEVGIGDEEEELGGRRESKW